MIGRICPGVDLLHVFLSSIRINSSTKLQISVGCVLMMRVDHKRKCLNRIQRLNLSSMCPTGDRGDVTDKYKTIV